MATIESVPRWDLAPFFTSAGDRALHAGLESVYADLDRLAAQYDAAGVRAIPSRPVTPDDLRVLDDLLEATNDIHATMRPISAYLYALVTTDSHDDQAASLVVELQTRMAGLSPLWKRLEAWVAALGPADLAAGSETAAAHAFALERAAEFARFQMSEAEEELASMLAPSGALAWQRLHGDVSSQIMVELRGADAAPERVPMTVARGLATDLSAARRRSAYEGELAAWEANAVPLAAAINGAKGETGVLNARRGYVDDLDPALRGNNVDRATLDAMNDAVVASLPDFRRYLLMKSNVLGNEGALPWWDLFAPIEGSEHVAWSDATALVDTAFVGYSPQLAALARRAFDEDWVDAEMRGGKRGGAYCSSFGDDVSRVMMNFDGSHESVSTLAHELGHAYHNVTMAPRTPIQRRMPMALAETASIFCETLLFQTSVANETDELARRALLDTYLVGATQVVVDIHSRFLFEQELCARRRKTTLSVQELCDTMLSAQDASYGGGLHADHRHPYMWAVKPHYFTPFYNWPYTFGMLFGIGLYARYLADPEQFRSGYDDLLASAGMADAATLGAQFGIDVRSGQFWADSLAVVVGHIDTFASLV